MLTHRCISHANQSDLEKEADVSLMESLMQASGSWEIPSLQPSYPCTRSLLKRWPRSQDSSQGASDKDHPFCSCFQLPEAQGSLGGTENKWVVGALPPFCHNVQEAETTSSQVVYSRGERCLCACVCVHTWGCKESNTTERLSLSLFTDVFRIGRRVPLAPSGKPLGER